MNTTSPAIRDDAATCSTDSSAVLEYFASGRTPDPTLVERVRARAAQVMADVEREQGMLDDDTFQSLLDDKA